MEVFLCGCLLPECVCLYVCVCINLMDLHSELGGGVSRYKGFEGLLLS